VVEYVHPNEEFLHFVIYASEQEEEPPELARWLQESGRRKYNPAWVESLYAQVPSPVAPKRRRYITQPELLSLFAMAALAYLLYYFTDVRLEILAMHRIVVFVGS
jgi:hypothetical protein